MIKFTIPGDPKPLKRARFFRKGSFVGTYDPNENVSFKARVAQFALQAGVRSTNDPMCINVTFYLRRPKAMMAKKWPDCSIPCDRRPDLDNLVKMICDGLNGIAYRDDGQIHWLQASKWYHEKNGVQRTEVKLHIEVSANENNRGNEESKRATYKG